MKLNPSIVVAVSTLASSVTRAYLAEGEGAR